MTQNYKKFNLNKKDLLEFKRLLNFDKHKLFIKDINIDYIEENLMIYFTTKISVVDDMDISQIVTHGKTLILKDKYCTYGYTIDVIAELKLMWEWLEKEFSIIKIINRNNKL